MEVKQTLVHNPYRKVNFNTFTRHLCNLHCHTTYSDGYKEPHVRVDEYHDAGFTILALTDHDTSHKNYPRTLYPWTDFELIWDEVRDGVSKTWPTSGTGGWVTDNNNRANGLDWQNRDPNTMGMLAIEGTELTAFNGTHPNQQDLNVYDAGIVAQANNLSDSLTNATSAGGWAVLVHPGTPNYTVSTIKSLKNNHPSTLKAIEIFHKANPQPQWQNNWDEINRDRDWNKPFYGMGADDAHYSNQLFSGYNQMFLPELNHEGFHECLDNGAWVFSDQPLDKGEVVAPLVTRISRTGKTLTAEATNYTGVNWLDDSGNVISTTTTVSFEGRENKFVRCRFTNAEATTLTQPFGVRVQNVEEDALFMI